MQIKIEKQDQEIQNQVIFKELNEMYKKIYKKKIHDIKKMNWPVSKCRFWDDLIFFLN